MHARSPLLGFPPPMTRKRGRTDRQTLSLVLRRGPALDAKARNLIQWRQSQLGCFAAKSQHLAIGVSSTLSRNVPLVYVLYVPIGYVPVYLPFGRDLATILLR